MYIKIFSCPKKREIFTRYEKSALKKRKLHKKKKNLKKNAKSKSSRRDVIWGILKEKAVQWRDSERIHEIRAINRKENVRKKKKISSCSVCWGWFVQTFFFCSSSPFTIIVYSPSIQYSSRNGKIPLKFTRWKVKINDGLWRVYKESINMDKIVWKENFLSHYFARKKNEIFPRRKCWRCLENKKKKRLREKYK